MNSTFKQRTNKMVSVIVDTVEGRSGVVHLEKDGQALCGAAIQQPIYFLDSEAKVVDLLCISCDKFER